MHELEPEFSRLLRQCAERLASDLHLSAGTPPILRCQGRLVPLDGPPYSATGLAEMIGAILREPQREAFERDGTLDLAYSLDDGQRFRINVYRERGRMAVAVRRLDDRFRTLGELHLPLCLDELADLRDGLVLVTGPTGSGKTTTLATLIHRINLTRTCHILTIEDPVEYLHSNQKSLVHQRELHTDVPSFSAAVRASLREDPDVVLVGEMRDLETMRAAITAAETGHLVFSTLHTGDAVGALERMVGVFPGEEQDAVRQQLSMVLRAVVAQRLLPGCRGDDRIPAVEILRVTTGVAHLIRTGKSQQIYSAIETGAASGMQAMEQALCDLVREGLVEAAEARRLARDPQAFEYWMGRKPEG